MPVASMLAGCCACCWTWCMQVAAERIGIPVSSMLADCVACMHKHCVLTWLLRLLLMLNVHAGSC